MNEKTQKLINNTVVEIGKKLGGLNGFLTISEGVRYYSNVEGDYFDIEFEPCGMTIHYDVRGGVEVKMDLASFFDPETILRMVKSVSLSITEEHQNRSKGKRQAEINKLEKELEALKGQK
jgi:hypothetical protein